MAPAVAVLLIAVLLGALVGTWPPFVAVESGSMTPAVERGLGRVPPAVVRATGARRIARVDPVGLSRLMLRP